MHKIRAIVIDPEMMDLREEMIEPTIGALYQVIGCETVATIPIRGAGDRQICWVDDDALLKNLEHGWVPFGWGSQPLMGKAVITDLDPHGDLASTKASVAQIARTIGRWHQGAGPRPEIKVFTSGSNCSMCDQRTLTADDLIAAFGTGRALCARCRGETK